MGRDAPTIQAAVDAAPPNTTVLVPAGTYREEVRIAKPVTVRGQNASLVGSGNGTVVRVTADRVTLTGLAISGVGNATLNRTTRTEGTDGTGGWDTKILHSYGGGDAGVAAVNASSLLVADVTVETPANGILLRRSEGTVVRDVTVNGTAEWRDGFMGVIAMNAPVVVQDSTLRGGRDGVYLHRAHGTVVRNNTFLSGRFGTHLMYTSDTLVADNRARGQLYSGIVVMTEPTGNAVVGNDVRHSGSGIATAGSRSTSPRTSSSEPDGASRPTPSSRCTSTTCSTTTRSASSPRTSSPRIVSSGTTSSRTTATPLPVPDRCASTPTTAGGTTGRARTTWPGLPPHSTGPTRPRTPSTGDSTERTRP